MMHLTGFAFEKNETPLLFVVAMFRIIFVCGAKIDKLTAILCLKWKLLIIH